MAPLTTMKVGASLLACASMTVITAFQPAAPVINRRHPIRWIASKDVSVSSREKKMYAPPRPAPKVLNKAPPSPADSSKKGNLALIEDTWTTISDPQRSEYDPSILSTARIDTAKSVDVTASSDASHHSALAWSCTSQIEFSYKVVECPDILDPANDALLFGHLSSADRAMAKKTTQRRLVVIDEHVDDLYGERLRNYFEQRGMKQGTDVEILRLPMVEEEKSIELVLQVCEAMKKFNIPRRASPVIAVGGGVCLDVVGLAATLFRRKTPYVRVPTTTLSYVDASVGAKSGVNFMGSKNRLGAYVPPVAALLDSQFLRTEERRAVASGVAEMSKMAIMKSPELFELLESHAPRLVSGRFQRMPSSAEQEQQEDVVPGRVLQLSIETMLEELAPNLWEASLDRLVDFGHAIGQELEMHALGTEHELTHGESVNVDMAFMTVLAKSKGLISSAEQARILKMLSSYGCPIWSPLMTKEFLEHALDERRKLSMGLRLPLPVGVGKAAIFHDVEYEECFAALDTFHVLCGPADDLHLKSSAKLSSSVVEE